MSRLLTVEENGYTPTSVATIPNVTSVTPLVRYLHYNCLLCQGSLDLDGFTSFHDPIYWSYCFSDLTSSCVRIAVPTYCKKAEASKRVNPNFVNMG